jgi:hypothetical protein
MLAMVSGGHFAAERRALQSIIFFEVNPSRSIPRKVPLEMALEMALEMPLEMKARRVRRRGGLDR